MYRVSPEAVLFTPCQYILLFATVIKGITPTTFNHVIYKISDFLHFPAKIKCTRAAPSYILFLAGKCKKSEMLCIIFSKRASKYHYWFKSNGEFAEWVDFSYLWSFSGGGYSINGASPSSFITQIQKMAYNSYKIYSIFFFKRKTPAKIVTTFSSFFCFSTLLTAQRPILN